MKFQELVGFPEIGKRIFRVLIADQETGQAWTEHVPAETPKEAREKAYKAIRALAKEDSFWRKQNPNPKSSFIPSFDGNGGPPLLDLSPDQYLAACPIGGINLSMLEIGDYEECRGCVLENDCKEKSRLMSEK
jgi:hypothetical protein